MAPIALPPPGLGTGEFDVWESVVRRRAGHP